MSGQSGTCHAVPYRDGHGHTPLGVSVCPGVRRNENLDKAGPPHRRVFLWGGGRSKSGAFTTGNRTVSHADKKTPLAIIQMSKWRYGEGGLKVRRFCSPDRPVRAAINNL